MLRKDNIPVVSELMAADPARAADFAREGGGWRLDFSGIPLDREGLAALQRLPGACDLASAVERLFSGEIVNPSENQPALHMALRASRPFRGLAADEAGQVLAERERFLDVARALHAGETGLKDLLHVGIGGSDLGPRLVADALDADDGAVRVHWLSTLDGRRFERLCRRLDPATTGLVVASKSFSTEETLLQASAARDWLGADWAARSWAATANVDRAREFGLDDAHILTFPAWTGGRFSLWSSVGVSAAAAIGPERFEALLAGAEAADEDFRRQPDADGLATLAGLLIHYLRRELDCDTLGFVSYEPRLALLGDYLQQLFMESLGKGVDLDGRPVEGPTVPLIFGGRGTDLQHSIFQALHQGPDSHPLVLVGARRGGHGHADWQRRQMAHLLAQASALTNGRAEGEPFQRMPGNRPVATLLVDELDARSLGWLLAGFEQAVYALSVVWRINPFDQWGVEEGKRLAREIRKRLQG
ncbi:glucose-6-phosphate isomerase [Wenzhouxiangella sediminis]|uniref:Glucose-6-phosphate isomerase n=1 Tax=Wenzhouxiangella sediminis TaxID=1792836 RepID=A0A3E1K9V1_9GAMM|nr:glucose-6-phosphate isomerase [Wenzhouxiangella sediminis]RFF30989.1 glucose-6-phosphate isomerase [Wenzhouxiangella sediminis]